MSPHYKGKKKIPSVSKTTPSLPVLHPHAAGIDIGAREIYVAVPPGSDPRPVRAFATFTGDLQALRDWLKACGVTSVAMESTGVYWIPLFQILEAAGIEVCLVNARHCKNLPGRKTDVRIASGSNISTPSAYCAAASARRKPSAPCVHSCAIAPV